MDLSSYFLLGPEPGTAMVGHYNFLLVILSYLVSSFAAYTAIDIAGVIFEIRQKEGASYTNWLFGGSLAMGCGVFAMHFVAMLAFTLEIPVFYDLTVTIISIVPAILGSAYVIYSISSGELGFGKLILTALAMAVGIGTMHYTGMYAMRGDMLMLYSPWLFALSIIVAKILALISLKVMTNYLHNPSETKSKIISAGIMGAAVCAMHYTAMTATYYYPEDMDYGNKIGLDPVLLGITVAFVALLIIGINLTLSSRSQAILDDVFEDDE